MTDLSGAFAEQGWVVVPRFVDVRALPLMIDELQSGEDRRVTVGDGRKWWTEYSVRDSTSLASFLTGSNVMSLISDILKRPFECTSQLWGQIYRVGQYIPWHKDASGTIQLLLCLEAAPPECGGEFLIKSQGRESKLRLESGDVIVFSAAALPHATTPIAPSAEHPNAGRIVAVGRYFEVTGDKSAAGA